MFSTLRSLLAAILGLLAGFWIILAGQLLGQKIYPPPPWLDVNNPDSLAAAMKVIPAGALAIVLVSWAVGTFIGSGIAARIAPTWKIGQGMIVGILFLMSGISNMSMFPHPPWFWIIGVVEFLPVAYLGAKLNSGVVSKDPTAVIED
jgi:hypothetical protein